MQVKKILVVGMGSIGRRHIQIIQNLYPEITIGVLRHKECDAKEMEFAGIDYCFTKTDDAISFKPHAAVISNPATMHLDIAITLAEAGVNLLVEKPISNSVDGVRELIDLCEKKFLVLMIGYNLRFSSTLMTLKNMLQKEIIGNLYSVRVEVGQYLPDWRSGFDYRQSVSAQKELGGGVLLELSHEIDYLLWLFGPIEWVSAHISLQSDLEIDSEDTAYIILGFKNKTANQQLTASLNMDFIRHDTTRKCVVIGENGTLRWDAIVGNVEYFPAKGKEWEELYSEQPARNYTYVEQIKHFIACTETGEAPLISGLDGMETLVVIDAVRKSSNSAERVYIKEIQL